MVAKTARKTSRKILYQMPSNSARPTLRELSRRLNTAVDFDTHLSACGLSKNGGESNVERTKELWLQNATQVSLWDNPSGDYGTFKDSLRAPIHRWFKYPAGYSYRLVEEKIAQYGLGEEHIIFDPFVGSGTTVVEAKRHRIKSVGVEAHPFVFWVAQTKCNWRIDTYVAASLFSAIERTARQLLEKNRVSVHDLPELVQKCYSPSNLKTLVAIREAIRQEASATEYQHFFDLALTDTLRNASKAATGWPYIAPAKMHEKVMEREGLEEFRSQARRMIEDLAFVQKLYGNVDSPVTLIHGDSRQKQFRIRDASVDLAITSPPYLNNYDYADRTRLETYFFGWYSTWGEITEQVRDKLMMSATTQVRRESFGEQGGLSEHLREIDHDLFRELHGKVAQLSEARVHKGGKKSYDCMVAGYFNDMLLVIEQVYRVLRPGSDFVLVLGDSAPYSVYIPTDEYLARLGLGVGFSAWRVEELRVRGDKWRENPQRHKVKLKEVILTLTK